MGSPQFGTPPQPSFFNPKLNAVLSHAQSRLSDTARCAGTGGRQILWSADKWGSGHFCSVPGFCSASSAQIPVLRSAPCSASASCQVYSFFHLSVLYPATCSTSVYSTPLYCFLSLYIFLLLSLPLFHFSFFIHSSSHSFTYPSLYFIHFFLLQLLYPNSFLLELFPTLTPSHSRLQQLLPTPTPFYGSSLLPRRLSRSLARNQFWQKFRPSPGVVAALCSQPEEARRGPTSRGRRK